MQNTDKYRQKYPPIAESMNSLHSASQQTQQRYRWQISDADLPAGKRRRSFPGSGACLVIHSALPQADRLGNCSSIAVVFSPTGISRRDVATQPWPLLGFSGSSVPSCSPERGKELAAGRDQNLRLEDKRRICFWLLYGQDKDEQCCGGNRVLLYVLLLYSPDWSSVISHFVEKELWVSFSSLPRTT